ncbi:MAG: hypothetical protein ABGZ17_31115 [Planctomycetaceae bacterium]
MVCETLRFVHAANLRFGAHVGQVARWTSAQRNLVADAGLLAFENLVDVCLEQRAEFLLISGSSCVDATDWRIAAALRRGLQRLNQDGVRVFVSRAESDPADFWSDVGDCCSNLTLLEADDTEPVGVLRGQQVIATLQNHMLCDVHESDAISRSDAVDDALFRQPFRVGILTVDSSFSAVEDASTSDLSGSGDALDCRSTADPIEVLPPECVSHLAGASLVDYVALANGDRPRRVHLRSLFLFPLLQARACRRGLQ